MATSIQQYLDTNCSAANESELQKNMCAYAKTILGERDLNGDQTGALLSELNNIQQKINENNKENDGLNTKQDDIKRELGLTDDVLLTRKRMLELSEEKNEFKQKTIYTLISAIIGVVLLLIVLYSFFFSN